jgi:hypothetical protein
MRVSDEDRHRAVDELRRHCAAGRIDVDEYATRLERALSASTLGELDEIRADLPMLRVPEPSAGGIWARSGHRLPAVGRSIADDDQLAGAARTRAVAALVAALTVAVVLGAIVIGLVAEWAWALVLIAGWAVGVLQGRLAKRPHRRG